MTRQSPGQTPDPVGPAKLSPPGNCVPAPFPSADTTVPWTVNLRRRPDFVGPTSGWGSYSVRLRNSAANCSKSAAGISDTARKLSPPCVQPCALKPLSLAL
jgi:hypothetical protein